LKYCYLFLMLFLMGGGILHAQNPSSAAALYEQGRRFMADEDWYSASEAFIECLRLNPAHAQGTTALAECYYELSEFDEALAWAKKAKQLARGNNSVAILEASALIALGKLDDAAAIISNVLTLQPYNREALFAAGELDIARGLSSQAMLRYRDALGRFPDDRRLLLSLALVSGSLGDNAAALSFIERALKQHPDDHRVFYYAAYVNANANRLPQAINFSEQALRLKPDYNPAQSLLANLRYRSGQYAQSADLADRLIAAKRNDMGAWYLKGLSLVRLGQSAQALTVFANAINIDPNDEFIRAALEDTLISVTGLEDRQRSRWAAWHFDRARDYRKRSLIEQALFEYRRGLRLNPYAADRREYADLLRIQGFPARYLEEIRFIAAQGNADRSVQDALETYGSLLSNALFVRWQLDPVEIDGRHWKIAVFSLSGQSSFFHADAGAIAASYAKEILIHERSIAPMNLALQQPSFSQAFRAAREADADFFFLVSTTENERDISLKGELFVARTGSAAASFYAYRTGNDRLRNASRSLIDQMTASLPFRGRLVQRKQDMGLIDKGKADGIKAGTVYDVVKKGRFQIANQGIGIIYANDDIVGKITIDDVDEEVSAGKMARQGFFDRIEAGDEILLADPNKAKTAAETAANPELRTLLRALR